MSDAEQLKLLLDGLGNVGTTALLSVFLYSIWNALMRRVDHLEKQNDRLLDQLTDDRKTSS